MSEKKMLTEFTLEELPDALSHVKDAATIRAARDADPRKGAGVIYDARLAQLGIVGRAHLNPAVLAANVVVVDHPEHLDVTEENRDEIAGLRIDRGGVAEPLYRIEEV